MRRPIITGIDIGTSTIRVVVVEFQDGEKAPRILGTGAAQAGGLRHGYISYRDEAVRSISRAIKMAEQSAGVTITEAFVALGGVSLQSARAYGSAIISRADGEVSDIDVKKALLESERALEESNQQILHSLPVKYLLDSNEVLGQPHGLKGTKLEVETFFVTSHVQHIGEIEKAVEATGIDIIDVVPSPLAASTVVLSRQQKTAGVALANIGSETVSLCVFENNIPVSLTVFPVGSTNITNDIALGLKISLDEAEEIKLGTLPHSHATKRLNEIIFARLSDIFELIDSHLRKIKRSGLLPAGVVLTGGGAGIERLEEFARESLKLPAYIGAPLHDESVDAHPSDASWAVAYGLCLWAPEEKPIAPIKYWLNKGKRVSTQLFKKFIP